MQVIAGDYEDAEAYVRGGLHRQVRPPACCPQCEARESLSVLGYYCRYVLPRAAGQLMTIPVRRFRCEECSVTVSLLPAFAQPYHLLGNDLLDEAVAGHLDPHRDCFVLTLFERMLQRFGRFRERLYALIGLGFGRDPPDTKAPDRDHLGWLWSKNEKSFATTTQALVRHYRCTVFGQYRCHDPRSGDALSS